MTAAGDSPPVSDAVLMTLAGIAYGAPDAIARYLAEAKPTAADWCVAWLPASPDPPDPLVNFAYMARNERNGIHVLAIRGSYPNPLSSAYWDNSRQDSPFGDMVDWPGAPGAEISAGTADALKNLLELADAQGQSLEAAVAAMPASAPLVVTGHSLGGTLAPVLALRLAGSAGDRPVAATSFAGMTPGNGAFAKLFAAGTPFEGKVRRVYNTLDTVPYGWDSVFATHDFYDPEPKGGPIVSALLLAVAARLELGGYDYTAVGTPVALKGELRPPAVDCELAAYVIENLHQHMPDTYLALLGAPPLPFSILFGTMVVPQGAPLASLQTGRPYPLAYL